MNKRPWKRIEPQIDLKDVVSELHREFHLRRQHIFKSLTSYAAFCGISVGWVVSANALTPAPRIFLVMLIAFFAIVGVYKGLGVSKSQSHTAKAIVKINEDFGLFKRYFPEEWKKWGTKKEYWYIWGFAGLGIVTSLIAAIYEPPNKNEKTNQLEISRVIILPKELEKVVYKLIPHPKKVFFLVYKDNAVLEGPKSGTGVELEKQHIEWLNRFYLAIKSCANNSDVELRILGHASSAEFMIDKSIASDSDNKNKIVANLRAKKVGELLKESQNIHVQIEEWSSYEEMALARPFNDSFDSKNITHQQLLNRSVSIEFVDHGKCVSDITSAYTRKK